jgi:hypothetical protein
LMRIALFQHMERYLDRLMTQCKVFSGPRWFALA